MALDGGWNPPELWPESTPPLPGWVRGVDGRWSAPVAPAPIADVNTLDLVGSTNASDASVSPEVIDLRNQHAQVPPGAHVAQPQAAGGAHAAASDVDHRLPLDFADEEPPALGLGPTEAQPRALVDKASTSNRRRIILAALVALIAVGLAGLVVALLLL